MSIVDFPRPEERVRDVSASNSGFEVYSDHILLQIGYLKLAWIGKRLEFCLVRHFNMAPRLHPQRHITGTVLITHLSFGIWAPHGAYTGLWTYGVERRIILAAEPLIVGGEDSFVSN